MKKNLGRLDRMVRITLAILLGAMFGIGFFGTPAAIVLGILAVVLLATSAMGFCPLYVPLNQNTIEELPLDENDKKAAV